MRSYRGLRAVGIGLAITLSHLALAIGLLAPDGSLASRYERLIQHDSFWFANIVNRGYQTTVPPIDHKVMEVSNVGFFPAYPVLAAALRYALGLTTGSALLITAQAAAWGFWSYFFLFCERWNVSPAAAGLGALFVLAHPASFFLIAGYSESLFLMTLLGFMYWSESRSRAGRVWACLHGGMMSATRIVGIPCALFPVVQSLFSTGRDFLNKPFAWLRSHWQPIAITVVSTLGADAFFLFCQLRWGHWDMYMLTQFSGWGITPDYLAIFRPSSYRWLTPALNNPTEASQMTMTIGGLMLVAIAVFEFVPALRRGTNWRARIGIYFCAGLIYFVSVSAVACVKMESMLRYEFCVHALIVLAFLHFLRQFRPPPVSVRALGVMVALASAAGLSVQGWYLWNFTRGNWIA
ncbi:MAG TPA: hypothetical protein VJ719_01480 [Chthoniobacterales bacterium]|nr:hypothetical protein [Chthoniobacterales bacterium]